MSYTVGITKKWPIKRFGEVVKRAQYGVSVSSKGGGEYPMLRMSNLNKGKVRLDNLAHVDLSDKERDGCLLVDGDFLFNRTNSLHLVGKAGVFRQNHDDHRKFVFASYLVRFFLDEQKIDPDFASEWLQTARARYRLKALATPGVSQSNINPTTLQAAFEIPVPPLDEQKRVVALLGAWDGAIETLQALIDAKTARKRGLMQKLLAPHGWGGRGNSNRHEHPLGQFLTESRVAGETGKTAKKITIRWHRKGVTSKKDALKVGSENTRYFKRRRGQLVYSKLDYVRGAVALIPPEFDGWESTLDLPAFDISLEINHRWLFHLISWPEFYRWCSAYERGGRKASRISPEDFCSIRIGVPSRGEQNNTANFLDTCDREIDLHRQQLEATREQKRGLMQKFLTGEMRVK